MARIPEDCRINQTDYDDVALGTTTVGDDGCAACCLALRLLSLMDTEVDDDLRKDAVEAIASSGFFTSEGWIYNPPQSQSVTVNSESYTIGYQTTSDLAAEILNGKTGYVHFEYGRASHYVFVDGINRNETNHLKKLLVVDPSDGLSKNLYEAMEDSYSYNGYSNITPSTTHLTLKCVFT